MPEPQKPDETQLDRIERKLDALIEALGEQPEEPEDVVRSLDGEQVRAVRDETGSLG